MVDFELIKGRIQKHTQSSIIHNSLELLNEVQRRNDKSFPIWNLLVLIKWTYLYTTDSFLRAPIKTHEFNQLLTLIREFETKYHGLSFRNKRQVSQSFRIIAYQQFALQDSFHNSILSRQIVLYLKLTGSFDIAKAFENLSSIKLQSFLEYCYFTFFFFHFDKLNQNFRYEGDLFESYFTLFKSKWSSVELDKFLSLLTIRDKEDFERLHKLNNERLQLYETSFFVTKPFLFFKGKYRLTHRAVFTQTVKHFIYNYLKGNCSDFPREFGRRLERYLELGLKQNSIDFENETALKRKYNLSKVSDFSIEPDILIEAKGIELHPRSGVIRTKDLLTNDLDKTIINAYIQLLSTASIIDPSKQWWGIIVTYKEMYLGFGADAWEEFLKESIEKYCSTNSINLYVLPPENLFFINVEDWDHIMQVIHERKASLKQILVKAKQLNASPNMLEHVMMMEQVLKTHFAIESFTLSYLAHPYQELDILPHKEFF